MTGRMALLLWLTGSPSCLARVSFLASYPRSGNHYLRRLVEEATGAVTFSQYRDGGGPQHPEEPLHELWLSTHDGLVAFAADGGYKGNCSYPGPLDPVLVKTHHPKDYGGLPSLSPPTVQAAAVGPVVVVCLHRFPLDAVASLIRYRWPNPGPTRPDDVEFLEADLRGMARNWTAWHRDWLDPTDAFDLLPVSYESLLEDPEGVLTLVLLQAGFVGWTDDDVRRAVTAHPPHSDGFLKSLAGFFTPDEARIVADELLALDSQGPTGSLLMELGYSDVLGVVKDG